MRVETDVKNKTSDHKPWNMLWDNKKSVSLTNQNIFVWFVVWIVVTDI